MKARLLASEPRFLLLAALLIISCSTSALILCQAEAQPVYVDLNAPGPEHDGETWDTAFVTIQEGVNAAGVGDEVWVADGVYLENVVMGAGVGIYGGFLGAESSGYEDSFDQRDYERNTAVIDGDESGSCVVLAVDAAVDGFTLTNGTGTQGAEGTYGGGVYCIAIEDTGSVENNIICGNSADNGGGIACDYDASPYVLNNYIYDNEATDSAGGIGCYFSQALLLYNLVCGNSADSTGGIYFLMSDGAAIGNLVLDNSAEDGHGGGIGCCESSPELADNVILYNLASASGGGIACWSASSPAISGNTIAHNAAEDGGGVHCGFDCDASLCSNVISDNVAMLDGGGIFCEECFPTVTNNTIAWNAAGRGGGIFCGEAGSPTVTNNIVYVNFAAPEGGGIWCHEDAAPVLSRNDFWGNIPEGYFGCDPADDDFFADPEFVDPYSGDWHITSGSPCADAGDNDAPDLCESDWEGEDRIINGTVDVGGDEYLTYRTEAPDPEPECDGPLFGGSQNGFPAWVWFSIPLTPDCPLGSGCADPNDLLGFACDGRLWYFDQYGKFAQVYKPPFVTWDLWVGEGYLLWLEGPVANPGYDGITPFVPETEGFQFPLGRQGWTWVGMPGLIELGGDEFLDSIQVMYPSDCDGEYRTGREDYAATPDNWITWSWPYWNTWLQAAETFTPYAPFGHRTCYPWVGYRVWVKVGTATDWDDPDQVTLVWSRSQ
jgi:hypothetical protein